jgi:hypothetical protein
MKSRTNNSFQLSGHVSGIGKEHILIIDSDKIEHSFKRDKIIDIKLIQRNEHKA